MKNGKLRNSWMTEQTYSVKNLIKILVTFPQETPVVGAWDSMFFPVNCVKFNTVKKAYDNVLYSLMFLRTVVFAMKINVIVNPFFQQCFYIFLSIIYGHLITWMFISIDVSVS